MKIVTRLAALALFVFFFFFTLKNTQEVTLHFFLGYQRTDPVVLLLLAFFVAGAVAGILAMLPSMLRHKKEAQRHKRALATLQKDIEAKELAKDQPPVPDSVLPIQPFI